MNTDVTLGNLWNKLGRHLERGGEGTQRRFLRERQAVLQQLLQETTHHCAHAKCDARGLVNIVHGAVKSGMVTLRRPTPIAWQP